MLTSPNIYLRSVQSSDEGILLDWENDPENWEVSDTKEPYTKEQIKEFVNSNHDIYIHCQYRFMICLNNTNQTIGCVDLFEFDEDQKRVGVGILIGDASQRNKGYAFEALQLLIDYCKKQLKISCIFCHIFKENTSSIRLFEKCGFKYLEERELFGKTVAYYELKIVSSMPS